MHICTTNCEQIGCDVFSLVELEHCVLKGSAALHKNRTGERIDPKSLPKHWPTAPSQDDPRFKYACTRVRFLTVHCLQFFVNSSSLTIHC
jgi:hypothetical protein